MPAIMEVLGRDFREYVLLFILSPSSFAFDAQVKSHPSTVVTLKSFSASIEISRLAPFSLSLGIHVSVQSSPGIPKLTIIKNHL